MMKPVELTYRKNTVGPTSSHLPPTLFIHGLDSSSHTWRNTLDELESRAVALDMRGCGRSPLGDAKDFCPDAIVNDIYTFLSKHPYFQGTSNGDGSTDANADENEKDDTDIKISDTCNINIESFVLVGHSMGGRIAMSFAAKYPTLIKAIVIEDMDIRQRPMEMNAFQSIEKDRESTISFDRNLNGITNEDSLTELFTKEGYPIDSVSKWLKEGRVVIKDMSTRIDTTRTEGCHPTQDIQSYYYSEVNPAFRLLCYEQFFVTNHGEETWTELSNQSKDGIDFPLHVMVADKDKTVCDEKSIWDMKKIMKGEGGNGTTSCARTGRFMVMHRYKGATHSIHNSASKEFLNDLRTIIRNASLGC
eukprot:CAMPEP_0204619590 /NCGR_PEP_ID=MMETSP0717-20131115/5909_1 /ASSEMBLY_ACC=CAM_ASM_000666 /TAXON_ID=230516 /ORGANISM="Chaetoceros curvisetus" /LENGTH=360 /DNA_ID=CAMNT_0051633617 /DNA_START=36 /DNA_END=1118 /DNA_ORIENTATION=+